MTDKAAKKRSLSHGRNSIGTTHLQNRSTPYTAPTPRLRTLGLSGDDEENFVPDAGLAMISWQTYRVTPLTNFSYDKQKLNEYGKYLSSYVEKVNKKSGAVLMSQQTSAKAKVTVIHGIGISDNDSKAIKIQIFEGAKLDQGEPSFTAVLASVERDSEPCESKLRQDCFTYLPIMLTKGSAKNVNALVTFLDNHFGGVVQPLTFSHVQLLWMVAMWATNKHEDNLSPLMMEYSTPVKECHTIQYVIEAKYLNKIWNNFHDPSSNVMTEEEVHTIVQALEKHFKNIFSIDLSCFHLRFIGTTVAAVHRNGMVKIMKNDFVRFVLRHLTSLAQELTL